MALDAGQEPVLGHNIRRLVYLLVHTGRLAGKPRPTYDPMGEAGLTE